MARVKRAVNSRKNHKKVLKLAKGYYGGKSRLFKTANETVIRALRVNDVMAKRTPENTCPRLADRFFPDTPKRTEETKMMGIQRQKIDGKAFTFCRVTGRCRRRV